MLAGLCVPRFLTIWVVTSRLIWRLTDSAARKCAGSMHMQCPFVHSPTYVVASRNYGVSFLLRTNEVTQIALKLSVFTKRERVYVLFTFASPSI
jgi:hypothetical protein